MAKVSASTGRAFDTAFRPTANPTLERRPAERGVWALLVLNNGNVVLGGDFGDINGVASTRRIAVVDPSSGTRSEASCPSHNNGTSTATILDLATDGTPSTRPSGAVGGACTAVDAATGAVRWTWHSTGTCSRSGCRRHHPSTAAGHFGGTASFSDQTAQQDRRRRRRDGSNPAVGPRHQQCPRGLVHGVRRHSALPRRRLHQGRWRGAAALRHVDRLGVDVRPGRPVLSGTAANGVVHLSWQPPSSDGGSTILRYKIWRKWASATTYPNAALAHRLQAGRTSADTTVTNATAYSYKVLASTVSVNGPYSNELTVTPGSSAPAAPSAPSALDRDAEQLERHAQLDGADIARQSRLHDVRRLPWHVVGATEPLASVSAATTTFSDALPPSGTTFFYAVRAVNHRRLQSRLQRGERRSSSVGAPTQPTLSATTGTGRINLSWVAGSGGGAADMWIILRDNVQLAGSPTPTQGPTATPPSSRARPTPTRSGR